MLVATLALLAMASFEAVAPLPSAAVRLQATLDSGRRLLALADRDPAVTDPAAPAGLPAGSQLTLDDVGFAYGDDESWDLSGLDLRLAPGRRVALVGPSGAGKSTIAALLVRFLDPDAGCLTLADRDLRELRQRDVRSRVTLDSQDAYLFSTTIRENVRLARPGASDAEIERALAQAQVWEWVRSLPEGLDTFVGEEGAAVSGGERRRIALARTFSRRSAGDRPRRTDRPPRPRDGRSPDRRRAERRRHALGRADHDAPRGSTWSTRCSRCAAGVSSTCGRCGASRRRACRRRSDGQRRRRTTWSCSRR